MFPEVEVYRYVTEQTFDAYLYQLVESKQKFISQIMTSKSPVRSAEDVDEVALSLAEVKMLATGDERFKEKMDLDIQVSKLKVLKQSYLSEHYDLEDRILKHFPQTIAEYEQRIVCYEADTALAEHHKPQGEEKFCPMTLRGISYTEKAAAGEMLLAICKEYPLSAPIEIGSYRGFKMEIFYDTVGTHYCLNLCGKAKYKVELGSDPLGNLTRIENELAKLPARLEAAQTKLTETIAQLENAKVEDVRPALSETEALESGEKIVDMTTNMTCEVETVSKSKTVTGKQKNFKVVDVEKIKEAMTELMWTYLYVVGNSGLTEYPEIKAEVTNISEKKVSDSAVYNAHNGLLASGIITAEKISAGSRWFLGIELTQLGVQIYIEKYGKAPA